MRLSVDLRTGKRLVAEVDATQEATGREILNELAAIADAPGMADAIEVELDWSILRLHGIGQEVLVEEPDYMHNPRRFIPSLLVTCSVFDAQQQLLRELEIDGDPATAQQYARVSREALQSTSVVGYRHTEAEAAFCGWQIVSAGSPIDQQTFGQYAIHELAAQRRAWIAAMVLPAGWSFRCVGNTVVDCVSPMGRTYKLQLSVDI